MNLFIARAPVESHGLKFLHSKTKASAMMTPWLLTVVFAWVGSLTLNIVATDPRDPSTKDFVDSLSNSSITTTLDVSSGFLLAYVEGTGGERINGLSCYMTSILGLYQLAPHDSQESAPPATFQFNKYKDVEIRFNQAGSREPFLRSYMISSLYLMMKFLVRHGFFEGTWSMSAEERSVYKQVGRVSIIRHERPRLNAPSEATNAAQASTRAVHFEDSKHYNTSYSIYTPPAEVSTFNSGVTVDNQRPKIFYKFSERPMQIQAYLMAVVFGLVHFALHDAGGIITENSHLDVEVAEYGSHLLVTEYLYPRRMEPPFFLNIYAALALRDLAGIAVESRRFFEVEAVVEMGEGRPVGFLNLTRRLQV